LAVSDLPAEAGSYALHLQLAFPQLIRVGKLGAYDFPAGEYVYLGSAHGSGGLRARVGRHLRVEKPRHWHIDYLLARAGLLGLCWVVSPTRLECSWSQALTRLPTARLPIPGFGASDCRSHAGNCRAHLLSFPCRISPAEICAALPETGDYTPVNWSELPARMKAE
jgi:Uri superfamily endonuclease